MTDWFHRTCEHSASAISEVGVLIPRQHPFLSGMRLTWFTSQASATRAMLGLSSGTLDCDRMQTLWRVIDEDAEHVERWSTLMSLPPFEPNLPGARRLMAVRGTRPGIWGVSAAKVRVERVE